MTVSKERQTGPGAPVPPDDRALLIAGGAAGLLFGLHPLHVEPAVWISGRKDLLCALFFMLSIAAYTGYVRRSGGPAGRRMSGSLTDRHYLLAMVFFGAALLSKAMAVTLPVVLLVLDWHPFRRIHSLGTLARVLVEKLPFFALSAFAAYMAVQANNAMSGAPSVPLMTRVLVAGQSLVRYISLLLFPRESLPYYPYPLDISLVSGLPALGAAAAITTACIIMVKKQRMWLTLWGLFVVLLLPVLGIVQISEHSMADRYAYLPAVPLFALAGLAAARFWTAFASPRSFAVKVGAALSAVLLLAALAATTRHQIAVWRDSITFWSYIIEKEGEQVPAAYANRAWEYKQSGRLEQALEDYTAAVALVPDSAVAYTNRGIAYKAMGRLDLAVGDYNRAITLDPFDADAFLNRGLALQAKGQLKRAVADFNTTLLLDPSSAEAFLYRGNAFAEMGQARKAVEDYTRALTLNPSLAAAYLGRALQYRKLSEAERAGKDFESACARGASEGCEAAQSMKERREGGR